MLDESPVDRLRMLKPRACGGTIGDVSTSSDDR